MQTPPVLSRNCAAFGAGRRPAKPMQERHA